MTKFMGTTSQVSRTVCGVCTACAKLFAEVDWKGSQIMRGDMECSRPAILIACYEVGPNTKYETWSRTERTSATHVEVTGPITREGVRGTGPTSVMHLCPFSHVPREVNNR